MLPKGSRQKQVTKSIFLILLQSFFRCRYADLFFFKPNFAPDGLRVAEPFKLKKLRTLRESLQGCHFSKYFVFQYLNFSLLISSNSVLLLFFFPSEKLCQKKTFSILCFFLQLLQSPPSPSIPVTYKKILNITAFKISIHLRQIFILKLLTKVFCSYFVNNSRIFLNFLSLCVIGIEYILKVDAANLKNKRRTKNCAIFYLLFLRKCVYKVAFKANSTFAFLYNSQHISLNVRIKYIYML